MCGYNAGNPCSHGGKPTVQPRVKKMAVDYIHLFAPNNLDNIRNGPKIETPSIHSIECNDLESQVLSFGTQRTPASNAAKNRGKAT